MAEIRNGRSLLGLCPVSGHIEDALGLRALIIKELGGVIDYQTRVIMLIRGEGAIPSNICPPNTYLPFITHRSSGFLGESYLKMNLVIGDGDAIQ